MNPFEKFIERVAGSLLALTAAIYLSGFIIVNAYLSRFHTAQIEILQPAFIASGLFYCLAIGLTVTLVWPIARVITEIISYFNSSIQQNQIAAAGTNFYSNLGKGVVATIVIIIIIAMTYFVEVIIIKSFLLQIIAWASPELLGGSGFSTITIPLRNIVRLQGMLALPAFLIVQNWQRCGKFIRDLALTLSVMIFVLVQAYSLLLFAEKIYGLLPSNIGGGQPVYLRFYVTPAVAKQLDSLDDTFTNNQQAIVSATSCNKAKLPEDCLIVTNRLTWFWQIKSVNVSGNEEEESYFIRPVGCESCPIVKIYRSSVFSVAYDQPPGK